MIANIRRCFSVKSQNCPLVADPMKKAIISVLFVFALFCFEAIAASEEGTASYYADSLDGNPTASGEAYDKDDMTAAHRSLPFGTKVKVTNLANEKSAIVRINDRGPYAAHRIIDVSGAAARKLDMLDSGTATVRIEEQ